MTQNPTLSAIEASRTITSAALVETGTQATTAIEDVTDDVELVAFQAADMQIAQSRLAEWFQAKLEIERKDLDDANESLEVATKANWKTGAFTRRATVARKRVTFYEKCLAAIEAGYVIVPNFPVDIFALRTRRRRPLRNTTEAWSDPAPQQPDESPVGEGRYVDSIPNTKSFTHRNAEGEETRYWYADQFDEEVEFPVSIAKPQVMDATQRAMALKIFDEIGCLPERRTRRGDPIVTGTIVMRHGYQERRLTFLIAWYVDTRQL